MKTFLSTATFFLSTANFFLPTVVSTSSKKKVAVPQAVVSSYPSMTKLKFARNQYDAELAIQVDI